MVERTLQALRIPRRCDFGQLVERPFALAFEARDRGSLGLQAEGAAVHHVANNPAFPGTEEKQHGSGIVGAFGCATVPGPAGLSDFVLPGTRSKKPARPGGRREAI